MRKHKINNKLNKSHFIVEGVGGGLIIPLILYNLADIISP